MGLANPHSKTQAMSVFREYLSRVNPKNFFLFMLGEVDCGFVIWYRAQKYKMSIEEQFTISLNNYLKLIQEARSVVGDNIVVCSVPLPTIRDGQRKGDVANKRLGIQASLKERTGLTLKYSEQLKEYCRGNGLMYLDFHSETLNPMTGIVDEKFINENPEDHHLSSPALGPILYEKLIALGFR